MVSNDRALDWLESHTGWETFKPGLQRLKDFLSVELMTLRERQKNKLLKIITVAGTNGKGETSWNIAQRCRDEKLSYSLFTSPHILKIQERIESNGRFISDDVLLDLFEKIKTREQQLPTRLSFFEVLFVSFCIWSLENNVSVMIVEVGLGGRMDAANVLDADVVALTSISRDHQQYLGKRFDLILKEKWGVTRPNQVIVSALELSYLRQLLRRWKKTDQIWLDYYEQDCSAKTEMSNYRVRNHWCAEQAFFHATNIRSAKDIPDQNSRDTMLARGHSITFNQRKWFFYGSHNVDGIRHFCREIQNRKTELSPFVIWFGPSERPLSDLQAMLKIIYANFPEIEKKLMRFAHPRALTKKTYDSLAKAEAKLSKFRVQSYDKNQLSSSLQKNIIVVGSYFFAGEIYRDLLDIAGPSILPSGLPSGLPPGQRED